MNVEKFLNDYRQQARDKDSSVDMALVNLLMTFNDDIEPLYENIDRFHKNFRQIDVIELGEGKIDSAIWNLLRITNLFWDVWAQQEFVDQPDDEGE